MAELDVGRPWASRSGGSVACVGRQGEDTALAQTGQSRKDRGPRAWPDDLGL